MTGFSKQVRQLVVDRAAEHCEICGAAPIEQIHHRRPRAKGGTKRPETHEAANGLAICVRCHQRVESRREYALDRGWLVHQYHHPETVPVFRHEVWVLLQNSGGVFVPPQGPGRCERCGFHTASQGHRDGCQLFGQGAA